MVLDTLYTPHCRNNTKPWKWIIIDSIILAGIAFVSALPSNRLPTLLDCYVAVKAFIYVMLFQVAVERGLKPAYRRRKRRE